MIVIFFFEKSDILVAQFVHDHLTHGPAGPCPSLSTVCIPWSQIKYPATFSLARVTAHASGLPKPWRRVDVKIPAFRRANETFPVEREVRFLRFKRQ
jgi:hypothetical protein